MPCINFLQLGLGNVLFSVTSLAAGTCYVMLPPPTFVLDEGVHLLLYAVVPVGDVHMEGVVAAGLLVGPLPPLVVRLNQAATWLWDHMVHCRSGEQERGEGWRGQGRERGKEGEGEQVK